MPSEYRIEMPGLDAVTNALKKLKITDALPALLTQLGVALVRDVKVRIATQDGGKWKPASKWILAKKGTSKPLRGAENSIFFRVKRNELDIGSNDEAAQLSKHHKGFTNLLIGPKDRTEGKAVILDLVRPSALGVRRRDFHFAPTKKGTTPARKIWPDDRELIKIGDPIASRWLQQTLKEAGI